MTPKSKDSSKDFICIHYKREDLNYGDWALWLWELPFGQGKEYYFNGGDEFGAVGTFPLSNWGNAIFNNIGLIIKPKGSWDQKDGNDKVIILSKFKKDENNTYHIYLKEKDHHLYDNKNLERFDYVRSARFVDFTSIRIVGSDFFNKYEIYKNGELLECVELEAPTKEVIYKIKGIEEISFDDFYEVYIHFANGAKRAKGTVKHNELYRTKRFDELFIYEGELGAIYSKECTTFKVWSPVSKTIKVRIYKNGTPSYVDEKRGSDEVLMEVDMVKDKNGVFSCTINKDLAGKYYTYVVTNVIFKDKETVDPYARSTGINGLRGMIVDFSITNPKGFENIKPHPYDSKHLTVYETHIADLSSSSTWTDDPDIRKLEKTFLGACKEGTTYTEKGKTVSTGFDHIKELGVNAVQLLPIFDQANDEANMRFNWGYNPANYNTLEGGYSTDPYDGYSRIKEFKILVKKYHDAGINIIMDVVYNHLNCVQGSNFDILMPGYYFRYNADGSLSNGSGCGNETASEMPMMRKFIIDSVLFLAKEYKFGGFRFDLMGLHDLETMAKLTEKLKDFDKNIVVYGEPWCGGGSILPFEKSCNQANLPEFKGFGAFNDKIRDTLVRLGSSQNACGWVGKKDYVPSKEETEQVVACIKGCIAHCNGDFTDPNKMLNYVSCHDNYTIYDKLVCSHITDESEIKKISMSVHSIIFTSNGISFMLAGEEFLRTKYGVENSYNSSYKINEIDYSLKIKNADFYRNFQKLIKFKQSVSEIALDKGLNTLLDVDSSKGNVISYSLKDKETSREYKIFHVNGFRNGAANIVNLKGYTLYLDTINSHKSLSEFTSLIPYETLICYKESKNE